MFNAEICRFLSIVLVVLVFSTGMASAGSAFGDQKSSPKIECKVDTDVIDHNKNTVVGPVDLQCNSNNSNIKDSTVIQNPSNGNFEPLLVVSTDPSDGDNNVPTDLSEIKVTFNKKIDKNTVDTGSLALFVDNCGTAICNNPNIVAVSVSGKSITFTIDNNDHLSPDTNYIASLLSNIKDEEGNPLDCANSKMVDDNCEWQFSTSGSSGSSISLNPTSGPVFTSVTITGTAFPPDSPVAITFDGNIVATNPGTVTANSNGEFSAIIIVPISLSGAHTIGANLASKTFTVTSSTTPIIVLDPNSGPVGTSVNVTGKGYSPASTISITFDAISVTTNPPTVSTNANGEFSASFIVPSSSSGDHTVKATQGSNTASQTFTVTTNPLSNAPSESMIIPDVFA